MALKITKNQIQRNPDLLLKKLWLYTKNYETIEKIAQCNKL